MGQADTDALLEAEARIAAERASAASSVALIPVGEDVVIPEHFSFAFNEGGLCAELDGRVIDGKPECVGLKMWRLNGAPIGPATLRWLPLKDWTERAAAFNAISHGRLAAGDPAAVEEARHDLGSRVPYWMLAKVAAVYRACEDGAPTLAVANAFNVSRATAARLVAGARDVELLEPASSSFLE